MVRVVYVILHQVYYYNARTRESSWLRPVHNVRVMTQKEIETMAAAQAAAKLAAATAGQPAVGNSSADGGLFMFAHVLKLHM